jgi:hypothetical protein
MPPPLSHGLLVAAAAATGCLVGYVLRGSSTDASYLDGSRQPMVSSQTAGLGRSSTPAADAQAGPPTTFAAVAREYNTSVEGHLWHAAWECAPPAAAPSPATANGSMGTPEWNAYFEQWWTWRQAAAATGPAVPRGSALPAVAFGVQGRAASMAQWLPFYRQWASRAAVTLFLLAYDAPFNCSAAAEASLSAGGPPHTVCLFAPGTTWTTGRNALARAMFHAEEARGARFRYWAFSDHDTISVTCARCPAMVTPGDAGAACCMDSFVSRLVGPLGFATVGPVNAVVDHASPPFVQHPNDPMFELSYFMADCSDAALQAFHREAVPTLLPYFHELDAESWWSSQALLFFGQFGCLRGANVVPGMNFRATNNDHAPYPRQRNFQAEQGVIQGRYPSLGPWPIWFESPILGPAATGQGDCGGTKQGWRIVNASDPVDAATSAGWRYTREYAACMAVTAPRFCSFMRDAVYT